MAVAITPGQWRAKGDTFGWRGESMFYRVDGNGPGEPVLAIHGFPTASWDFAPIWDRLTATHRVLTLDMLGFGFSAKPPRATYSIMTQADLFEALLAKHGITRYQILAHDYGVTVAQELLARDRGAITKVCLLNGGLFPETHRALPAQKLLASPLGPIVSRLLDYKRFKASMQRIWGTHPLDDADTRAMWELILVNNGKAVMPKLIGYMAERRKQRERWVGQITSPRVPIRVINGVDDPVSGAHMLARYRELVRAPDIVELPGVGHYPQVEAPDETVAAILEFTTRA